MNWLKELLADAKGIADDARVNATFMIVACVIMGGYGIYVSTDKAAFIQSWGIGAGALATGIGALFALRKDN